MIKINPIELVGPWRKGYALDKHTISSEYTGEDENGNKKFNTIRSDIGEQIYQLKYKSQNTTDIIVKTAEDFIRNDWAILEHFNLIVPVPPSNSRTSQPVFEICKKLGHHLNKHICIDLLLKNNNQQLKGLDPIQKQKVIKDSIILNKSFKSQVNILLLDDLYQSGTTLKTVCELLNKQEHVNNIYVLTITKTK